MDGRDFVEAVRAKNKTELSRLGSSKSVYADTAGEMEPEAVLTAAADSAHHAAATFDGWSEGEAGEPFAEAAERERDHYDGLVAELGSHEPGAPPAVVGFLRERGDVVERLGGLVGWSLVGEEKATQYSGFFTGQADPGTATLFREFGDDYETIREAALDALATACEDGDWERAQAAATAAVEAAYGEYVETLEGMGVNPKPVC